MQHTVIQCNVLSNILLTLLQSMSKPNLHYTRGITPKRVTSGGVRLRGLAPGQHSSEETMQRWRAVGNTVSGLTVPGIKPQT